MLGYWVISNNAVLKVLEIEHGIEESVVVQLNEMAPERVTIEHKPENDSDPSITVGEMEFFFRDCMRA
jgi:hypothetical protein